MQTEVVNSDVKTIIQDLMQGMRFKTAWAKYNITPARLQKLLYAEGVFYDDLRENNMRKWEQDGLAKTIALYNSLNRLPEAHEIKNVIAESVSSCRMQTLLKLHLAGKSIPFATQLAQNENNTKLHPEIVYTAQNPQEIFTEMERLFDELERMPSKREFKLYSNYTINDIHRFFGRWQNLIGSIEIKKIKNEKKKALHDKRLNNNAENKRQQLLDYLHVKMSALGRAPKKKDMLRDEKHNYMQYYRNFNSFYEALELAGINNCRKTKRLQYNNTIKVMLETAVALYTKYNRIPTDEELKAENTYTYVDYKKYFGSIYVAFRKCGFNVKTVHANYIPDEQLLQYLKDVAKKKGAIPAIKDVNSRKVYSYMVFVRRFGSWSKALTAAGLAPRANARPCYSNEHLINHLQALAKVIGRQPRIADVNAAKSIMASTYTYRFGTWKKALLAAGFDAKKIMPVKFTRENIMATLKGIAANLGYTPSFAELAQKSNITYYACKRYFNDYDSFCTACGLTLIKTDRTAATPNELVKQLQQMAHTLGRTPKISDVVAMCGLKMQSDINKCGGLLKLLRQAKLPRAMTTYRDLKPGIINELKNFSATLGYTPAHKDFILHSRLSIYTKCTTHFKSYKNAVCAAGLVTASAAAPVKDNEILELLKEMALQLGRLPSCHDFDKSSRINYTIIYKRFKGLPNALAAAGLA